MSNIKPVTFTGHQIEITAPLREFTTKKFDRILRHYEHIISVDVIFEVVKLSQIAKATVNTAGKRFHADSDSSNMYESVDLLVDKLERQLKEHHTKEVHH